MNVISMRRPHWMFICVVTTATALLLYLLWGSKSIVHKHVNISHQMPVSHSHMLLGFVAPSREPKMTMASLSPAWNFQPDFVHHTATRANGSTKLPLIPHIIHQVWDSTDVPDMFTKWIPTWLATNPGWQHWFWTLDDVRDLVARHYPEYLTLYDSYTAPIFRADVMRYFVLHHYGGVYVDLDMEAVRPLNEWAANFHCIVTEENYEHSFVIREQQSTNLVNGVIACAPGHPFLKLAIQSLDEAANKYFGDYIYATGPQFFNSVWRKYEDALSGRNATEAEVVTVLPPYYFLPTYDPSESEVISGKCWPSKIGTLPLKSQIVCRELARRSFHNTVHRLAYANHYWVHAYMYGEEWKKANLHSVFAVVPKIEAAYMAMKHFESRSTRQ